MKKFCIKVLILILNFSIFTWFTSSMHILKIASQNSDDNLLRVKKLDEIVNNITNIENTIEPETITEHKIIKKERPFEDPRQEYISFAYEIWWFDLVTLIECENAERDPERKAAWKEESYGFCQINKRWHKEILNNSLFWEDRKRQINKCNELMKWWTKFYWRWRLINWKRCDKYVQQRFTEI